MKRWKVRIQAVGGTLSHDETFWTKRRARQYARILASPIYDVVLVDRRNNTEKMLHPHVPPDVFLAQLKDGQHG